MLRSRSHDSRKISSHLQNPKSVETEFKEVRSNSMASFTSCPRSVSDRKHHQSSSSNKSLYRSRSLSLSKSFNREKQSNSDGRVGITCSCSNSGLLVFVLSLCVTVFWGRVCGILFTTILFYFLHRRSCIGQRSENMSKSPETEREYKKRVIMEGLLERNHHLREGN